MAKKTERKEKPVIEPGADITPEQITAVTDEIRDLLISKNAAYGNAVSNPLRVFSAVDASTGIRVRIDDKLSRLARGHGYGDEDTILDLVGYLVLLRIVEGHGVPEAVPTIEALDSAA